MIGRASWGVITSGYSLARGAVFDEQLAVYIVHTPFRPQDYLSPLKWGFRAATMPFLVQIFQGQSLSVWPFAFWM